MYISIILEEVTICMSLQLIKTTVKEALNINVVSYAINYLIILNITLQSKVSLRN